MSINNDNVTNKKKIVRKTGRTILINSTEPISTDSLIGMIKSVQTTNGSQFLLFDTIDNSKDAFRMLRQNNSNLKIKFAHYRVFFTMSGLDDNVDYTLLKKEHTEWLTANTDANVLYYKQYKKNNQYLGYGDFTIDTKESLDKLLNKDEFKNYTFNNYSGTYYRYNKKPEQQQVVYNT
jgi:hypothetical protein